MVRSFGVHNLRLALNNFLTFPLLSLPQEIYLNMRVGLEKYHENIAKIVDGYRSAREGKILELETLITSSLS